MSLSRSVLIWVLIICCQVLVVSIAEYFNFHNLLLENDKTKLSFFIIFIWGLASMFIGYWHTLTDKIVIRRFENIGWYLAETCMALGMLGTVSGFLMMLGAAFANIDVANTQNLQSALSNMAAGMSTALYTTLIGLIMSMFIKSQLVSLEHYADGLP
jgi:hypothetical protein